MGACAPAASMHGHDVVPSHCVDSRGARTAPCDQACDAESAAVIVPGARDLEDRELTYDRAEDDKVPEIVISLPLMTIVSILV